jgi:hypothetical protein
MEYVLSVWTNVHDNAVKMAGPGDWNWVLEQLGKPEETDNKNSVFLFNLSRFDAAKNQTGLLVEDRTVGSTHDRRVAANIVAVTGLVIDYDNESLLQPLWTIEEVAKRFADYAFLIYSSHSYWKNYPAIERFRLVLPFSTPLAISSLEHDWRPYLPAIKEFIGYEEPKNLPEEMWHPSEETGLLIKRDRPSIDKQSFNPVQGYYLPSCPVGKSVVYRQNQGRFFDPSAFARTEIKPYELEKWDIPENATRGGSGAVIRSSFDVLQWLKDQGLYLRPLAAGKHQIICPWHQEHTKARQSGSVLLPSLNDSTPNIYCQHNHDVSTWKLIKELSDDVIRPYCFTRSNDDYAEDVAKTLRRHRERRSSADTDIAKKELFQELLPGFTEQPVYPYPREKRADLIRAKCFKQKKHQIMLLYAFEGFGKSYYAYLAVTEQNRQVLFSSLSNEQASEQAESFRQLGLRVQFIPGREYLLRTLYKVEIQRYEQAHPWDTERLAESPTKKWMKDNLKLTDAQIEEIWIATESPPPDWANHDIVCTTIARTMAYGRIQSERLYDVWERDARGILRRLGKDGLKALDRIVPTDAVVVFDDPDKEFFTWYKPYDPKFLEAQLKKRERKQAEGEVAAKIVTEEKSEDDPLPVPKGIFLDQEVIKIEKINGRDYFVRPEYLMLGYALVGNSLVFTTTEELTRNLILNMYPDVYEPKLMPDEKMIAGDITMISTNIVSSKRDGFLQPIMNRLKKEKHEFHYIADGQGSAINLVNNKGQNIFANKDTVIETSEPHNDSVTRFIDELHEHGWTESDRNSMKVILALDALQQAIGRNSGYRWSDQRVRDQRRCIVLCEPKLLKSLIMAMRYHVGTVVESVDARVGAKKEYTTLVDGLCWYIRNLDSYLKNGVGQRGQAFWDDVQDTIRELPSLKKRTFKKRLIVALKAKIKGTSDVSLVEKLRGYIDIMGE